MELRLKCEYVEKIKRDSVLYGLVADALNIGAPSLAIPLKKNSVKLTQKSVLKVLSKYLKVREDDLYEEIEEPENA